MSYSGFGRQSGPSAPPRPNTAFGQFPRPPPPSPLQPPQPPPQAPTFPRPAPVRSPPRPESLNGAHPPLVFSESNFSASRAPFSAPAALRLSESFPKAVEGQKPLYGDKVPQFNQRSPGITSLVATRNSGSSVLAKVARSPDQRRSSFPSQSIQRDTTGHFAPQPRPPVSYEDIYEPEQQDVSLVEVQRANESFPKTVEGRKPFYGDNVPQVNQRSPGITSLVATCNSGSSTTAKIARSMDPRRTSLPSQSMRRDTTSQFSQQPRPPLSYEDIYEPEQLYTSPAEAQRTSIPRPALSPHLGFRNNYTSQEIPHSREAQRTASIPTTWNNRTNSQGGNAYSTAHPDLSPGAPYIRPYDSRRGPSNVRADAGVPSKIRSPLLPLTGDVSAENLPFGQFESRRTTPSPLSSNNKPEVLVSQPRPTIHQNALSFPNVVTEAPATKSNNYLAQKRTRPTSPLSTDQDLMNHQNASSSFLSSAAEAPASKASSFPISKRTRSPSPLPSNQELDQHSHSSHDDLEREMQAKAKRLARFKIELKESPQSSSEFLDSKVSSMRHDPSTVEGGHPSGRASMDLSEDYASANPVQDYEGSEQSSIIIGLCPDMCPESERAERERKGDLDQYERVDGDRNQTSEFLAVKKYTRTAEREANLIRPMPVLKRTIGYLLSLLDQPYDDQFLGIYNFLWDRMRAVRMDLRMQHIFNLESVKMLEQMIRLHIIAMHELCEYEKGEGFSEGFDAHLNIEQMNKASAELFQLYDDHRRNGIDVPTEKEFRGYYALLKLDRHPGYKVEPAELSLDLAKMTPEIRQTSEIRFAREVARACRTGNFISFFRLARKASYLQACLMHAHFAKLRSQALASLHSGLQSSQGLPVSVIASWLAMEEEDIESVLQYHGFVIKDFEEPYMVKEGPFLHSDKDYPTKCSNLVHLKKSPRIVDDVISSPSISSTRNKATKVQLDRNVSLRSKNVIPAGKRSPMEEDEILDDSEAIRSLKWSNQEHLLFKSPAVSREKENGQAMASSGNLSWNCPATPISPKIPPVNFVEKFKFGDTPISVTPSSPKAPAFNLVENISYSRSFPDASIASAMDVMLPPAVPATVPQELSLGEFNSVFEIPLVSQEATSHLENEEPLDTYRDNEVDLDTYQEDFVDNEDKEVAEAKLKLILRSWKRRSSKRRELREQRQLVAADALNSLTLGPPIQRNVDHGGSFGNFDIDRITRERYWRHEQSWSRLNVADVAAGTLADRNPQAKCLCWKLIVCSPMNGSDSETRDETCQLTHFTASRWLLAKLMPNKDEDDDDELVLSYPGLSIWREWLARQSQSDLTCCLSVVRDINYGDDLNESLLGASAVLFLLSEIIDLEHQKIRLQNLLNSLPSGSQLPLLILSESFNREAPSAVSGSLGLHEIDRSKICNFTVVYLTGDEQMDHLDGFFSDRRLREGLQWLASESPPQPVLLSMQTRNLVQSHLNSSLEIISRFDAAEDLNQYIAAFNEAVDQSLGKIITAASSNSSGWPCPEIGLLTAFCDERGFAEEYLPRINWSLDSKIKPLSSALGECKLPNFNDDLSWLRRGCYIGEEIERQRLRIEDLFIRYLTHSTDMMGIPLARNEASVMVQRNVQLELRDSAYFMIPLWEPIFRRIFNWRLMTLSCEEVSTCYILEQDAVPLQTSGVYIPVNEEGLLPYHSLEYPSLDEMLQVGCIPRSPVEPDRQPKCEMLQVGHFPRSPAESDQHPEVSEPIYRSISNGHMEEDQIETEGNVLNCDMAPRGDVNDYTTSDASRTRRSTLVVSSEVTEQSEKLSRLLQQCTILQGVIDEKLSVYFG